MRSVSDARLLLEVALFAAGVPLLMRLPLPRLQHILRPPPLSLRASPNHVLELVDLALAGLRPLLRPTCLTRGVTRCYFLRRAGVPVDLAFGMSAMSSMGGHCWLVREDEPYLEARDPRPIFTEMFRI